MEKPSDPELEESSTQQHHHQANKTQQNASNESAFVGSSQPNDMPISKVGVVAPTQLTIKTSPRPSLEPSSSGAPMVQRRISGSGNGGGGVDASAGKKTKKRKGRSLSCDRIQRPKRKADNKLRAICVVCRRNFPTHYALIAHPRSHDKREWEGAFPAMVNNQDGVEKGSNKDDDQRQQPATTHQVITENKAMPKLFDIAQVTFEKMQQERTTNPNKKLLEFDLNVLPQEEEDPYSPSSSVASSHVKVEPSTGFDLNFPPPKDHDDAPTL